MKLIRMINKQMETIGFDPVSGNEVPLGGTPEGVRDDIDAKLSKGEMVIPEYAVNYHGVETYIDSIQKAQEGYRQLEDMGLVGNPDEAIMDESEPLPKMEDKDIPEYQIGGLTTTPLSPVSLPSIPAISSANVTQPLAPVSTQVTPTMQTVGSFDASTLQVGGYKIIPYVNDVGNTIYVASINGQTVGNIPAGYSPATDPQTTTQQPVPIQQQTTQQPIQQPVKVEPKVTISPAGSTPPATAVPSATIPSATTSSTGKSSLSAENQATIQSIHSQPNLSAKDIVAQTAPDAKSFLSKPVADLGPLGKIDVGDISKVGISLASSFLGLPPGTGTFFSGALGALTSSQNQPATAMMQGAINPNTGKPSIVGTGYHPASGWSFHATQTPFGLATVSFNDKDVTLNTAPSVVQKGQLALAFNKDFTGMTDTEISESMQTDSNGHIIGFNAPNAIGTRNGGYLSDGSFQSALGKSATGYSGDFSALSAIDQAAVSFMRSQQPLSFLTNVSDAFKSDEGRTLENRMNDQLSAIQKNKNLAKLTKTKQQKMAIEAVKSDQDLSKGISAVTGQSVAAIAAPKGAAGIQGIQSGGKGGGAGAGGGKIICLELHKQGLLDTKIFEADEAWGDVIPKIVLDGYHLWAKPIVRKMRKSRSFSKKIAWFANPVAKEAAKQMKVGKGSKIGLTMLCIGMPICAMLGVAMLPFKQKNKNLILGDV